MLLDKLRRLFMPDPELALVIKLDQATINAKLKWSVFQGEPMQVARLMRMGAQINSAGADGQTALHTAVRGGRFEMCAYLLRHGANVNLARSDGQCALHIAAAHGSADMIRLLLKNGARPARKDRRGRTAHDLAEAAARALARDGMSKARTARWVRLKELASLLRDAELAAAVGAGHSIGDADPMSLGRRDACAFAWM